MTHKKKTGDRGEDTAVKYLMDNGFSIVERNYRKRGGEIDIIAKDDETLVFVEVKSSSGDSRTDPLLWLDNRQLKRIIETAGLYISENYDEMPDCRYDLCVVRKVDSQTEYDIEHIPDAFRGDI